MVFGIETDSYDMLGIPIGGNLSLIETVTQENIALFIQHKEGKQIQSYPPYSSKAVEGKPLHWWAKRNRLHEINIPNREIFIEEFFFLDFGEISKETFLEKVMNDFGTFVKSLPLRSKEELIILRQELEEEFIIYCESGGK